MLTLHLRKEWREQRAMLVAFAIALLVCALITLVIAPKDTIPSDLGAWFAIGGLTLAFVGLISDLVPGESRRNQLDLLRRTPGAMRAAFAAKWLILLAGLLGSTLVGFLLGEMTWHLGSGTSARSDGWTILLWCAAAMITCTPLAFACSCWFGRGSGALPATALVFGLVAGVPFAVVSIYRLPVAKETVFVVCGWCVLAGLVASYGSFSGLRFGRRVDAAKRGLLASTIAVVPVWGLCGQKVWDLYHFDPSDEDTQIIQAFLSARSDRLFVNVSRDWENEQPYTTLIVELGTGEFRQTGSVASHYFAPGALTGGEFLGGTLAPQDYMIQLHGARLGAGGYRNYWLLDGEDGSVLERFSNPEGNKSLREIMKIDDRIDLTRETTPLRLPDGTRAWLGKRTVIFEDPDGTRHSYDWPVDARPSYCAGFGFAWWIDSSSRFGQEVFDLYRRRSITLPEDVSFSEVLVAEDHWLIVQRAEVRKGPRKPSHGPEREYRFRLWNPDSGEFRELDELVGLDYPILTSDGDFLAVSKFEPRHRVVRLDPLTQTTSPIRFDGEHGCRHLASASWRQRGIGTQLPDGTPFFTFEDQDDQRGFARLEGDRLVSTARTNESIELQAILSNDEVLVLVEEKRLERWRFGSDQRDIVFAVGG